MTETSRPIVTHVVRQFWPQLGGLEESVRQLARTLHNDFDTQVEIVTLDRTFSDGMQQVASEIVDGVPVRRLPYRGSIRYPLVPGFYNATGSAHIIHVHAIDFFFDALALTRSFRDTPLVASTHGGFFHTEFAAQLKEVYFSTITRAACRAYEVIGASSEGDAQRFRPIAGNRVEVIENGVDIDKWAGTSSPVFKPVMIAIGRWSSNKNMEQMFALLAALQRREPAWRMIIAGNAYDVSRADLDQWATKHDVCNAVDIHAGVDTAALGALIGQASFFISLSDYEGFGLAAVEGLSAGLIPILSSILNYRLFVERAGVGGIVDSDVQTATTQVLALAADVAADHSAHRNRAIRAAQRYGWHDVAKRWHEIYTQILAQRNRPARVAARRV